MTLKSRDRLAFTKTCQVVLDTLDNGEDNRSRKKTLGKVLVVQSCALAEAAIQRCS